MRVGIITGSGTYSLPGLEGATPREVVTGYGETVISMDKWAGADVLHLSRHGNNHRLISNNVTHQANIMAMQARAADLILAVTVCGSLDPKLELGTLVVFDDLHFPSNRLPDGSICTIYTEPGQKGRGHWIFDKPYAPALRAALLAGAQDAGHPVRDGGVYGYVDGPRFNSKSEIAMLQAAGVTAVSQTAGPETVLAGEAEIPYALLGYVTDYANGVAKEDTPLETLLQLISNSAEVFADTLAAAIPHIDEAALAPVGDHFRFG